MRLNITQKLVSAFPSTSMKFHAYLVLILSQISVSLDVLAEDIYLEFFGTFDQYAEQRTNGGQLIEQHGQLGTYSGYIIATPGEINFLDETNIKKAYARLSAGGGFSEKEFFYDISLPNNNNVSVSAGFGRNTLSDQGDYIGSVIWSDLLFEEPDGSLGNEHKFSLVARTDLPPSFTRENRREGLGGPGNPYFVQGRTTSSYPTFRRVEQLPEHIIVLNHGWQPSLIGGGFDPESVYLQSVYDAITDRYGSQIESGEVVVVATPWEEAFTGFGSYSSAYRNTEQAGRRVAEEVQSLIEEGVQIDTAYDPTIHIIGHSLGTLVSAYAVNELNEDNIHVDQVTLLDTPRQSSGAIVGDRFDPDSLKAIVASYDDALIFWQLMPQGSVDYVENYYSTRREDYLSIPFGQPIAGTGPRINTIDGPLFVGQGVDESHNGVHNNFYKNLIRDGEWTSPVDGVSYDLVWNPTDIEKSYFRDLESLTGVELNLVYLSIDILGNSDTIDEWQHILGEGVLLDDGGYRLVSRSPSAVEATLDITELLLVEFSYDLSDSDGELFLIFEDQVLWSSLDSEGLASVLLTDLYGEGSLVWRYESELSGSYADLHDVVFFEIVQVPEPSSFIAFASLFFVFNRRRKVS